ncbi:MAG: ParB/RepB/Spo0J family partition protein [Ruminococcus sp.]|nr:ParB/RepB/Spo0J family partition protein [Ruminococcus sp.]
MTKRKSDFTLPTLDDLFSTQKERDDAKLDKIRDIPLSEIDSFPNHPFQVRDDEDMLQLAESIKSNGVMTPAVLRLKDDGRYELVAGHRRKRACELAGLTTLRSEVKDMTYDQAVVYMVESNFQRSAILPSEKAFAYKMRLDAMKRQAGRPSKENASPLATDFPKGRSDTELANQVGESKDQIRRYIRLTSLIPELLQLVDEGRIKMRPAVELSYLSKDCQLGVYEQIELNQCTPSHDQTIRMRKLFERHKLTPEAVEAIMMEEKPNQRERMVFNADRMRKLLPRDLTPAKTEDFICDAIEFYCKYGRSRYQERQSSDRDAR